MRKEKIGFLCRSYINFMSDQLFFLLNEAFLKIPEFEHITNTVNEFGFTDRCQLFMMPFLELKML